MNSSPVEVLILLRPGGDQPHRSLWRYHRGQRRELLELFAVEVTIQELLLALRGRYPTLYQLRGIPRPAWVRAPYPDLADRLPEFALVPYAAAGEPLCYFDPNPEPERPRPSGDGRVTRPCAVCGTLITRTPSRFTVPPERTSCSAICQNRLRRRQQTHNNGGCKIDPQTVDPLISL